MTNQVNDSIRDKLWEIIRSDMQPLLEHHPHSQKILDKLETLINEVLSNG